MKNFGSNNSNLIIRINTIHYIFCITIILLLASTTGSIAQNTWLGGTPGAETNWDNPKNWSENRVPDWSDNQVVIPDVSSKSGFFPVIQNEVSAIAYLFVKGGAKVTVTNQGRLTIDGESTFNYGIQNVGMLVNEGKILVHNTALEPLANSNNPIVNKGGAVAFQDVETDQWITDNR